MLTAAPPVADCQVELDIAAGRCTWRVARPDGVGLSGQAADLAGARRQSQFAAVMLEAFAAIGRRRF